MIRFASQARRRSRASCPCAEPKACRCTRCSPVHIRTKRRHAQRPSEGVGVVVLRPVRVDKEISSRPTYSGVMVMDGGFWGGYYGHGWGSARSAGKFVPTHHRQTLVYSLHQNKLVVGAKQDYESRKSESPDREHGQTGRRRARAARADYERGLITEEVHKSDHAVREHARVRAATRFRRTLGSIAWERKENEHDYPDQSRRYRTARILRGRVRDASTASYDGALTVTLENDTFTGSDNNYTNGLGVAWVSNGLDTYDDERFVSKASSGRSCQGFG